MRFGLLALLALNRDGNRPSLQRPRHEPKLNKSTTARSAPSRPPRAPRMVTTTATPALRGSSAGIRMRGSLSTSPSVFSDEIGTCKTCARS